MVELEKQKEIIKHFSLPVKLSLFHSIFVLLNFLRYEQVRRIR